MKLVFADTLYWIAIVKPNDPWTEPAKKARLHIGKARIVTTDEVLIEFLNSFAPYGNYLRQQAVEWVEAISSNSNVKVLPQTRDSFLRGVELYGHRLDKGYSLTDCISMNTMKTESVSDILTNDTHFMQEGFNVLIKRDED